MPSSRITQPLEALAADIRKGLATVEQIVPSLPANLRRRYGRLADGLRTDLENVEQLHETGRTDEAVDLADEAWRRFRTQNPPRAVTEEALDAFAPLVASILPPLELIENIARLTVHLGGLSYDLWKARILHLPFSPAVTALVLDDPPTGFALLTTSSAFTEAFGDEMALDNQTFASAVAERYLTEGDVNWLWEDYSDRFETEEDFRAGAEEFRAAADGVIMTRIDAHLRDVAESAAVETTVGYDTLVAAIDRVRADEEAAARLDALVTVFEALHRGGGRLPSVLDKVKNELEAEALS